MRKRPIRMIKKFDFSFLRQWLLFYGEHYVLSFDLSGIFAITVFNTIYGCDFLYAMMRFWYVDGNRSKIPKIVSMSYCENVE